MAPATGQGFRRGLSSRWCGGRTAEPAGGLCCARSVSATWLGWRTVADDVVKPSVAFASLSPRAIRDAVLEEERAAFTRQYRAALAVAAETLDLTGVEELLRAWQRIAELTARDGRENRRQILAKAVRVWRNRDNPDPDAVRRSREFDCCGNG